MFVSTRTRMISRAIFSRVICPHVHWEPFFARSRKPFRASLISRDTSKIHADDLMERRAV